MVKTLEAGATYEAEIPTSARNIACDVRTSDA